MTDTPDERDTLLERMHGVIQNVVAKATVEPGGDRAYFGSTNDLDALREIDREYFDWWCELANKEPKRKEQDR